MINFVVNFFRLSQLTLHGYCHIYRDNSGSECHKRKYPTAKMDEKLHIFSEKF